LHEISFRMMHVGCPFADISKAEDATIVHWCNDITSVYEVRTKEAEKLRKVVHEFRRLAAEVGRVRMRILNFDDAGAGLVLQVLSGCLCLPVLKLRRIPSVVPIVRKHRCVQVPPTIWKAGWEYFTVLSFRPSDFKGLFRELGRLGPVEITSKKSYRGAAHGSFAISLPGLFSELTPKQLCAFMDAVENGYYAVPRRTTIGKIARAQRVARTTYDDHLRKAQSKIAIAISPYLRIYAAGVSRA